MSAPTLSVLITYHDERELLRDCIESFQKQASPPDEILIHDDASSEAAEHFLPERFTGRILHSSSTLGPARARNILWRASQGDCVHFHDADDRVLPGWSQAVRTALEGKAEAVFTEVQSRRGSERVSSAVLGWSRWPRQMDLVQFCLQGALLVPAGTYRRRALEAINGYRESLWQGEDFDFHVRLAAYLGSDPAAYPYRVIAQPLVEIRLRAESRSRDQTAVWTDGLKALEFLVEELPIRYADDLAEAAARIGSQLYRIGAHERALQAFALAGRLGTPRFTGQGRLYRWVARSWGPRAAERLGRFYRQLPTGWRQGVRAHWQENG